MVDDVGREGRREEGGGGMGKAEGEGGRKGGEGIIHTLKPNYFLR